MSKFAELIEQAMRDGGPDGATIGTVYQPTWSLSHLMTNHDHSNSALSNILVEHHIHGTGVVTELSETTAAVKWDRLGSWAKHSGKININEAGSIIVIDSDKYLGDQNLSEEIDMTKQIMSTAEYMSLMEDTGLNTENPMAPKPSETIMTNVDKSPESANALSGLDGNGGAMEKPYEEKNKNKGGEGTSMADLDGDGGAMNKPYEEKSGGDAPADRSVASMGEPSRSAGGGKAKTKTAVDESWTFEDADFDNLDGNDYESEMSDEADPMDGGSMEGISMTQEFMLDLFNAIAVADLDGDNIAMIVDGIAECGAGKTLDVADIADVMATLKDSTENEDVAVGDEEMAGPEGGEELEGETQLMGDMDESCDKDEDDDEDEDDDKDEKEQLDEAWLMAIPNVGNPREAVDNTGLTEEDIEMNEIKRLAGMM
jgi:hypothetical protein